MKDITVLILGLGSALLAIALYFVTKSVTGSVALGYLASAIVPCTLLPLVNKFYPPANNSQKQSKDE